MAVLSAQILSHRLLLGSDSIVPWLYKKVIDYMGSIQEEGYMETVTEQAISIFMVAVPLLWKAIDSETETTMGEILSKIDDAKAKHEKKEEGKDNEVERIDVEECLDELEEI
eukprot:CAMPEP_0178926904 /NCGR_PEP_ID=MMETSP0786-20121207/18830_1 /TAXON_ID=186022 /ORGANISM="Thalassionema frauenfeldii, Strain CCMP 1798" /LENGTH=111 /DNA_ID=CAMNT_0020602155 /DNA_START=1558 /DNA_END=1898 /DNA_ORIENTATION=-